MTDNADEQIAECIRNGKSFVLDAGAGAGKTYSLVEGLRFILREYGKALSRQGQRIACITFTNVAKDEIASRTHYDELVKVSTIHDFLWEVISHHQKALKAATLKYNSEIAAKSSRKVEQDELEKALTNVAISYSDRGTNLLEGRLHHDDLLNVAKIVFTDNPFLSRLVAAKYPFLFVDEYQDTSSAVVSILLENLLPQNPDGFVIGLFGDKLQNIYHGGSHPGIGEIPAALAQPLKPIVKEANRRCSVAVINVLNHIRTDIQQYPAADNVQGNAVYVHVANGDLAALQQARDHLSGQLGWDLPPDKTKELYLTHRLIAHKGGYGDLLAIFTERGGFYRDQLISGEDSRIALFIKKLEPLVDAWSQKAEGVTISLLRQSGYVLSNNAGKQKTKDALDQLLTLMDNDTVRAVLTHVRDTKLFPLPDDITLRLAGKMPPVPADDAEALAREERDKTFFESFFNLSYSQIRSYVTFFNEHTPFATKHGVKGAEFGTVLVVLDDQGANWNIYSFAKYLSGEDDQKNPGRAYKTRNVFYVCCSRAKQNLAVIDMTNRSAAKDAKVKSFFGENFCYFL